MEKFIHVFILLPLVGFFFTLLLNEKKEKLISSIAYAITVLNLSFATLFVGYWLVQGGTDFNLRDVSLYQADGYNFYLDFYFDHISATFLMVGNLICFMVVVYSRFYMHRESGFKRFFNTILFFYTGYTITILSGNFETLFIGWEILGISSFLLIAFYRLRYLPVKNALKVFTIYRIGDVGILLAMWMSHHLWHENVTFIKLHNYSLVHDQLLSHSGIGIFISLMILLAALAKSAQLPFSAWLPRAMEGPTPSSAIFYGSLSVHIGVFLLLRTMPFWEHQTGVRWIIALAGLSTAIITSMIARVQSTVKGQIAYSSSAQIGIIFVEIAAGLEVLALIHFVGNAFLRSYQLLISPSVVTYLVREQFYHYQFQKPKISRYTWAAKMKNAAYLLAIKEWNLDSIIFKLIFKPLKAARVVLGFITMRTSLLIIIPIYLTGLYVAYQDIIQQHEWKNALAILSGLLALLLAAKAYNERKSSRLAWLLVVFAHFFVDMAVTFNDHFNIKEATIYLSGIVLSGLLGYWCLHKVKAFQHHGVGLNQFHGLVRKYQTLALLFLLASLGIAGFPITTAFFGEDLILTHIHEDQVILAALVSFTFIINGIAVIRIYARVFLGYFSKSFQQPTELTY